MSICEVSSISHSCNTTTCTYVVYGRFHLQVHLSLVQHCLLYILQTMVLSGILSVLFGGAGLADYMSLLHSPLCDPMTVCSELRYVNSICAVTLNR